MNTVWLPWLGILVCGIGGLFVNTAGRTIWKLLGLFILFAGGSIMLLTACSFQTCLALLVCGIGTSVLLGTGNLNRDPAGSSGMEKGNRWFRTILAVIFALLSYTLTERIRFWIPVRGSILFAGVWISMMSLIGLTLDDDLLCRCIYLQCICLAFTIVYIYMENSVLVFGFFAAINLMMAFGGSVLSADRSAAEKDAGEDRL